MEYERGSPIYQDDDIDIRFDVNDLEKWKKYVASLKFGCDKENNLKIILKINLYIISNKLYLIRLIQFNYDKKINIKFRIFCDFIPNNINRGSFGRYNVFHKELRKIKYLGVDTYAPNQELTEKVLKDEYGKNYLIPKYNYDNYRNLDWIKK